MEIFIFCSAFKHLKQIKSKSHILRVIYRLVYADVFWTPYVRSVYVLCLLGKHDFEYRMLWLEI